MSALAVRPQSATDGTEDSSLQQEDYGSLRRQQQDGEADDRAATPDPFDDDAEEDPVLIQLIESSREMRRRAMRASHQRDNLRREEFVDQMGITYDDTVDPETGMSCLDVTDAQRAYYGHHDDAAVTAYRQSLLQLLDDLQWLKRERFLAAGIDDDSTLHDYIAAQVAYPSVIVRRRRSLRNAAVGPNGIADLQGLLVVSEATAASALRRAKDLSDHLQVMLSLQRGTHTREQRKQSSKVASGAGMPATSYPTAGGAAAAKTAPLAPSEFVSSARLQMIAEYREATREQHLLQSLGEMEEAEAKANCVRPLVATTRRAQAYKAGLMASYKARKEAAQEAPVQRLPSTTR